MLSVVAGLVDLIDDREREVGTGNVRVTVRVEQGDPATHPVRPGPLARRKRAVATRRTHKDSVEFVRRTLREQYPGCLALQGLRTVRLGDLTLDEARLVGRRPQ